MQAEIEVLEQRWEEWRWAKRKGMIREEQFPKAKRLLINRRCAQAVSVAEENGDTKELAGVYSRLHQGLSSPLNFRRLERPKDKGINGRFASTPLLRDRAHLWSCPWPIGNEASPKLGPMKSTVRAKEVMRH